MDSEDLWSGNRIEVLKFVLEFRNLVRISYLKLQDGVILEICSCVIIMIVVLYVQY